jgi:hypothetical protein
VYRMSLYLKQDPQNVHHFTIESDVVLDEHLSVLVDHTSCYLRRGP